MNAVVPNRQFLRFVGFVDQDGATRILRGIEIARERRATEIHLALSAPGGMTSHAIAVYNSFVNSAARIVTYNIGSITSAGTTAFLGGHERYASANSTFMIHPHGTEFRSLVYLPQLEEVINEFRLDEDRVEEIIRGRTQLDAGRLAARRVRDVHFTASQAEAAGFVHGIREFVTQEPILQL